MQEILEALNGWLAFLENPGGTLPPAFEGENAQICFQSRGFVSNRFICRFETEKVDFDVALLMNDRSDEEDALAIVELALVALHTPFDEKVEVTVLDEFADYNGGTLEDFLRQIDAAGIRACKNGQIILP